MVFIFKNRQKVEKDESKCRRAGFAVYIDTNDSELIYNFKKAMKYYDFKPRYSNCFSRGLNALSYGDVVLIGTGSKYDYEITTRCARSNMPKNKVGLSLNTKDVFDSLYSYYNPPKQKTVLKCECKWVEKPVEKRVVLNVEPYRVHDRFVKVGYEIFPIKNNICTGKRTVKIDGKKFLVKKDHCGNGYLA